MNRFLIVGAPCAGKSTYVRERSQAGELVYDYDTLHMALSGQGSHEHLLEIRPFVLAARDAVFAQLEADTEQAAWIISSTRKAAEAEALAARLAAEIIFLQVGQAEAHQRAAADNRPDAWHEYIDHWFANEDFSQERLDRGEVMKRKTFTAPMQFKQTGEEGRFVAIFATLNVKDHHGDVTVPGAFQVGQQVIVEPWNHGWNMPAGKGTIRTDDKRAWIEGEFFLETEAGRENYATVKAMGELAEWSYTFDILEAGQGEHEGEQVQFLRRLDVVGVSPVTRGAGIGTRTVEIKQRLAETPAADQNQAADDDGGEADAGDPAGKPSGAALLRVQIEIAEIELLEESHVND